MGDKAESGLNDGEWEWDGCPPPLCLVTRVGARVASPRCPILRTGKSRLRAMRGLVKEKEKSSELKKVKKGLDMSHP